MAFREITGDIPLDTQAANPIYREVGNIQLDPQAPAAPQGAYQTQGAGGFALGLASSLAKLGTGIQQRVSETGAGDALGGIYGKVLSTIRPDLAPELSNISGEDVRQATGNVGANINQFQAGQHGVAFNTGQVTGDIAPYLAVPGGPVAAGAASGGISSYLEPNQAPSASVGSAQALTNALYGAGTGAVVGKVVGSVGAIPSFVNKSAGTIGRVLTGVDRNAVQDFADAGLQPDLAAVGGRGVKVASQGLKYIPFAGDSLQKSAQESIDKLSGKVNDVADQFGPARTVQETGNIVQGGVNNFISNFKDKADTLFKATNSHFAPSEEVGVTNTKQFLADQGNGLTENLKGALINPKIQTISSALTKDLEDSATGRIPYETLTAVRSQIGRQLANPSVMSDIPTAQLKQFYGALTDDMKQAATDKGPAALQAFNRANNYYRAGIDRIDSSLSGLVQKGVDPEQVFKFATSGTKDGATQLSKIKKSLTTDEFGSIQSQVLRKMGASNASAQNAAGDAFSPDTFLTNWNKLAPESKNTLFQGQLRTNLDRLAKVSGYYKETNKLANRSNTSNLSYLGLGGAFVSNPVMTSVGLSGAYTAAKLMTSPRFVGWLADSAAKTNPSMLRTQIQKLTTIALNSDPDTRDSIKEYLGTLTKGQPENLQPSDTGSSVLPPAQ